MSESMKIKEEIALLVSYYNLDHLRKSLHRHGASGIKNVKNLSQFLSHYPFHYRGDDHDDGDDGDQHDYSQKLTALYRDGDGGVQQNYALAKLPKL